MYSKLDFQALYSQFHVTFGQMTSLLGRFQSRRSRDIISCYVAATSWSYSTYRSSNACKFEYFAFYSHFQVTSGKMTSLPSHFRSREVT